MKHIKKFLSDDKIGILSQIDQRVTYKIDEVLSKFKPGNQEDIASQIQQILETVLEKINSGEVKNLEKDTDKEAGTNKNLENILPPETYKWLSELIELGKESWSDEEYLKHVKMDLFQDRIFVITPKNDSIDLPEGATVLDFAYKIHRQVGEQAYMGKINGEVAKLNTKLRNGDKVEIITQKNQSPKTGWLDWVVTAQAARQIRNYLRKNQN